MAVSVRVAWHPWPGVQDHGDVEDGEHEHVAVVEPGEVVEHLLAQPGALQESRAHFNRG